MNERLACPECGDGPLTYARDDRTRITGEIISFDEDDSSPEIDLGEGNYSTDYSQHTEEVECQACYALWPSLDDFSMCLFAIDHEEECVL